MLAATDMLHLFTSDQRPLYQQDALDLLAAPAGHIYRFRYQAKYLGAGLADRWGSGLADVAVRAYFSQQQLPQHDPFTFIPFRQGRVTGAHAAGSLHFLDFEVGPRISLARAADDERQARIAAFSGLLAAAVETPRNRVSASLGPFVDDDLWVGTGDCDDHAVWETAVEYLQATDAFADRVFLRFADFVDAATRKTVQQRNAEFPLVAGRSYELAVVHLQPGDISLEAGYEAHSEGEVLAVASGSPIQIASRYDTHSVRLRAAESTRTQVTTVEIVPQEPEPGGSRVRVQVRVVPDRLRVGAGAFTAAVAVILAALPGIFEQWNGLLKAGSVAAGAALLGGAAFLGLKGLK